MRQLFPLKNRVLWMIGLLGLLYNFQLKESSNIIFHFIVNLDTANLKFFKNALWWLCWGQRGTLLTWNSPTKVVK